MDRFDCITYESKLIISLIMYCFVLLSKFRFVSMSTVHVSCANALQLSCIFNTFFRGYS